MSLVLQMRRRLITKPEGERAIGLRMREFDPVTDIPAWLELRRRAFAREKVGIRDWNLEDLCHELTDKPWWAPNRMWVAEAVSAESGEGEMVGAVTWADRGEGEQARPAIHWLCVHPKWRRRGVARALVATLETAVWNAGKREVWLETHSAWTSAVRFYESLGYEIVPPTDSGVTRP